MNQSTTQTSMRKIACLFMFTYMVSYITRINYGAVITEMVTATHIAKSTLSLALTGSFITYGAGQIISGICGDHFAPKKLVMYGLILSSSMNLLIPLCSSPYQMLVVWSINGFGQAFMWPPMVRMMTMLLSAEDYKKACVTVSWGSSFGTILVYLLSPLLIGLSGWKTVFVCSAVCGIAMIFIWNRLCPVIPAQSHKTAAQGISTRSDDTDLKRNTYTEGSRLFSPLMLGIMFAIVLQGVLRDGVTTWMPSYISETYHLGSKISILTGVLLPIFSIACFQVTSFLYQKYLRNPLACATAIFGTGAVAAIVLYLFSAQNAGLSVLLSAVLTGCMHGVNLILVCMIPPFFKKYGHVSTVSGVLNACTYIGSAISSYGIALLAETKGWHITIFVWFVVAALGTAVCLLCTRPWRKEHAAS